MVGGYFNYVGPPTGPFAIADGANATNFNTTAGLTGVVTSVVSDGAGGWFVTAGALNHVGLKDLAHVAPDGHRDPRFVLPANVVSVGEVAVDGGRLFLACYISVSGTFQPALLALDPITGAVLPWVPASVPTARIMRLVASQGVVYAAVEGPTGTSSGLALGAMTGAAVPFPALATADVVAVVDDRVYVVARTDVGHTLRAYTRAGVPVGPSPLRRTTASNERWHRRRRCTPSSRTARRRHPNASWRSMPQPAR